MPYRVVVFISQAAVVAVTVSARHVLNVCLIMPVNPGNGEGYVRCCNYKKIKGFRAGTKSTRVACAYQTQLFEASADTLNAGS